MLVRPVLALIAAVAVVLVGGGFLTSAAGAPPGVAASGYDIHRAAGSPVDCSAGFTNPYFAKGDCGFGRVTLAGVPETATVTAEFSAPGNPSLGSSPATFSATNNDWTFDIAPESGWPSGPITISMTVDGTPADGTGTVFVNQLGASVEPAPDADGYRPGDPIPIEGEIYEQRGDPSGATQQTGVPASFQLQTIDADGTVRGPFGPFTAASDGTISETLPAAATAGIDPDASTNYRESVRIELVDAAYTQAAPTVPPGAEGEWVADEEPAGSATVSVTPEDLVLENSFVSAVGWVKPGDQYPFTIRVKNFDDQAKANTVVTVTAPDSTTMADPADPPGTTATVAGNVLTWTIGTVDAATAEGPTVKSLIVEATADTVAQDPQIIWKNLSTTATATYTSAPPDIEAESHGPKVIPPEGGYETARFGDRPFPVVPVDFNDRPHDPASSAAKLATTINDPSEPGSTFNLYQEISYGQLFPNGTVPSDGIASADWEYTPGFAFTQNSTTDPNSCHGFTNANFPGDLYQSIQPQRISDGWYQLPGSTDYYGDDSNGSALIGAVAGVGALQDIDSACGPTGKAVYDAAQIADPEIDYSDYDTDKDGVVDFFMMIFAGVGGHGESQTSVPPYDNIWPHSSDLTGAYTDPATGLTGYVSDDQLRNLEGAPLWYTDATRTQMTTTPGPDELKVWVRVGPYNVNPENSIDKASVISHEYGHSLGLPDYYSTGTRGTYGSWTLMATDHSQNMDIVGKKELGWVVPRVLQNPGSVTADDWKDTKLNTHRIDWQQADGTPYTLQGPDVNNGQGYVAPLPARQILDPAIVPSGDHVWWSRSGNDFGCTPEAGHNLDIALPGLASVPAGTPVTLTFKSRWDIEWDFDYGFVLATTDNGQTYASYPSENGYTTPSAQNPQQISCQSRYGNGITGSSGSYEAGTQEVDRIAGNYPDAPFVEDSYDLSDLAGTAATLRLSYWTDGGLARPGWFIDDLKVTAGSQVLYDSDFETATDPAVFNGGCRETLQTAQKCTDGWLYASASEGSPAEHAYLMEMRDRSGFDAFGRGESDRGDPTFSPGMLLAYTDENHGYGNFGTDDPPAQSPLDSQPQPGEEAPNLDDAAYTAAANDTSFSDAPPGHVDNYTDPSREDTQWTFDFGCLGFDVTSMAGEDIGPENVIPDDPNSYNLLGDVNFTIGDGCGAFNYGFGPVGGTGKPTAVAQAKPTDVGVGERVAFDGSGSFDDQDAPEKLKYEWDLDGDGEFDKGGRQTTHAYDVSGKYEATLRVTDSDSNSDTDTVTINVRAAGRCGGVKAKISSGPGKQVLKGTKGRDVIAAFGGKDVVRGKGGNDIICGGGGKDKLFGGSGKDKLKGGKKRDRCRGGPGRDKLRSCER